jgi:hypothetical protein
VRGISRPLLMHLDHLRHWRDQLCDNYAQSQLLRRELSCFEFTTYAQCLVCALEMISSTQLVGPNVSLMVSLLRESRFGYEYLNQARTALHFIVFTTRYSSS